LRKHSDTIIGQILLYKKRTLNRCIVMVQQPVSRFPKDMDIYDIVPFRRQKISLYRVSLTLTLFWNEHVNDTTLLCASDRVGTYPVLPNFLDLLMCLGHLCFGHNKRMIQWTILSSLLLDPL
jgi:hypothetical protein